MSLILNVRHLETQPVRFEGELEPQGLDVESLDELIHPGGPLHFAFEADRHERGILLQGRLEWVFRCECARCLRSFERVVTLDPWVSLLPWEGEEAVEVRNDCVDLTPYLREDMLLELPQRPLCSPECRGLTEKGTAPVLLRDVTQPWDGSASTWQELDKLNF